MVTESGRVIEIDRFGFALSVREGIDCPKDAIIASIPSSLPFRPGDSVLDVGCGAGLFSLLALRDGCRVVATDVDPLALELTAANCRANNLPLGHLESRLGSLFMPIDPSERFDVIVANLPQTPCADDLPMSDSFRTSKWGGSDGLHFLGPALREGFSWLRPGGRLLSLQLGWLSWHEIDQIGAGLGAEPAIIGEGLRPFEWREYESYAEGLRGFLEQRIECGRAQRLQAKDGSPAFIFRWHVLSAPLTRVQPAPA